jgi:hypothetical protein
MKITFLSNKPTSVDVQDLLDRFTSDVSSVCLCIYQLKTIFDMICVEDIDIITASKMDPSKGVFGTKDLQRYLAQMSKIQNEIITLLASLKQTQALLEKAVKEGRQVAVTDTGVLSLVIPKARTNANNIPELLKEAKAIEHATQIQTQQAIETTQSIVSHCWQCLHEMNSILDKFPIDRTQDPYKHLPENESEL